jgi:hypothetical protein
MFRKNVCWLFLITALYMGSANTCHAQEEKLKSIFVYNFTRYFDWPQKPGNFLILILGKTPLSAELSDIALKKKVGNSQIEIRTINSVQQIEDCHILYVTASKSDNLPLIVPASKNKNFLVVTEKEGSCKEGSGINFIDKDGKLTFEISKTNIESSGLTVSSSLFSLGKLVN